MEVELKGADAPKYGKDMCEGFDAFGDKGAQFAWWEHSEIVADLADDGIDGFVGDGFLFVASGMKEHRRGFILEQREGKARKVTFSDTAGAFKQDGGGLGG